MRRFVCMWRAYNVYACGALTIYVYGVFFMYVARLKCINAAFCMYVARLQCMNAAFCMYVALRDDGLVHLACMF